jgi:WD40 repeat protein
MKILTIVVGSYEGSMYCFKLNLDWMNYTKHFSVNDSTGAIRSLALKNGTIFCGSKDESLRLYNHNKKQSCGVMSGHTGTVFKIVDTSKFLISGDDNGHVLIWGHRNKALYHILETGKHGLIDYDVHTSEKLLISIGPESL